MLPFSTCAEAKALKPDKQDRWLKVAEAEKLSNKELRARTGARSAR
jgi:hypothetical protein